MRRGMAILLFSAFILMQADITMTEEGNDFLGIFYDKFSFLSKDMIALPRATVDEVYSAKVYIDGSDVVSRNDKGDLIVRGDAGKDDVAVIKETISAFPEGKIVLDGAFKITNSIDNLDSNVFIKGIPGRTIFDCTNLVGRAFSICENNYERTTTDLIEDALIGDIAIAIANASRYNVNDYIKLIDDEEIMNFKKGQIFRIKEVKNNDLFLDKKIEDNYYINKNAKIRKLIMCENVTIEGIEFIGPGMEHSEQLLHANLLKNFNFINNFVTSFGESALDICDCIDCTIANNIFEKVFKPGMGYSIALSNACEGIYISNNSFKKKGRHYIAVGGATGDLIDGGYARDLIIKNNYFEYSTEEAINTHPPFRGPIDISDNTFIHCDKGLSIFNGNSNVYNNKFKNCLIGIQILSEDLGDNERIYRIHSNEFENTIYDLKIEIDGKVVNDELSEGCFVLTNDEMIVCNNSH